MFSPVLGSTTPTMRSADPANVRALTPEEQATRDLERRAMALCYRAAKAGYVMHEGQPAVIGTQENIQCIVIAENMIRAGKTDAEILKRLERFGEGVGPNWILWGAVGAAVLLAGAWILKRR
jgi:hypothetical protein